MKTQVKPIFKLSILALIILFSIETSNAQYVTTHSGKDIPSTAESVAYYLPQNIIRVSVMLEQTQNFAGPYKDYSQKLLGISDIIKSNSTTYRIVNVNTSMAALPDAEALFYVFYQTEEKAKNQTNALSINLSSEAIISSVGYKDLEIKNESKINRTIIANSEEVEFKYYAEKNFMHTTDTTIRKITIDTTVIFINDIQDTIAFLSKEKRARKAASKIAALRENRLNLLTGYNEIAYPAQTLAYMDFELKKMENDYLSLFLGKTIKRLVETTYYIVPVKGTDNYVIAKFSDTDGLQKVKGEELTLQINSTSNTNSVTAVDIQNINHGIVYRIPEYCNVKIVAGTNVYDEKYYAISQLGKFAVVPINNAKLIFDVNSGQLINMDINR